MTVFDSIDDTDDIPGIRDILGVRVSALTAQEARLCVQTALNADRHLAIAFLNAHNANVATTDPVFRRQLDHFTVLADGIGVDIASKLLYGETFPDNLNGTDFVPDMLARDPVSRTVALIGSGPGVAERAAATLQAKAPQHHYTVLSDGFFDERKDQQMLVSMFQDRQDILLVAMGTPKQEKWIAQNVTSAHCKVVIGVGALLDFMGGEVTRAPRILRAARMEWVWRLALEPARMWKRYIVGNPLFLYRVVRQKLSSQRR